MKKAEMMKFVKAAGVRAIKTFFQTLGGGITVGAAISEVNWKYILSVAVVATVLSICTSFAGLPELSEKE